MSVKIIYGFTVTVDDVLYMFPERVKEAKEDLSKGEDDVDYDAIVEQAVNITEGIDANYDGGSSIHVIGVVKDYSDVGLVVIPEITDEDRRKIELFIESNPAFKGRFCGMYVLVEDAS